MSIDFERNFEVFRDGIERGFLQDGDDETFEGIILDECSESERKRIKTDIEKASLISDLEYHVEFSATYSLSSWYEAMRKVNKVYRCLSNNHSITNIITTFLFFKCFFHWFLMKGHSIPHNHTKYFVKIFSFDFSVNF